MKHFRLCLSATVVASFLAGTATAADKPPLDAGIGRAGFDSSVRPQDDFFRFVNGTWLKTTDIPADKSRVGSFIILRDRSEAQVHDLIEAAVRSPDTADARRIADLYESFMDEAAVEKAGLGPLAGELAAIDAIASPKELGAEFGRLGKLGVALPVETYISLDARDATHDIPIVSQGGLLLPDRDYYLVADDAKFAAARAAELVYLGRLLTLSGSGGDAAAQAQAVQALETALARAQSSRVENRNPVKTYNKLAVGALADQAAGFDWAGYLAGLDLAGKAPDVVVRQPTYVAAFAAQVAATPLPVWKAYLRSHLLHSYAPYLGKDYVDARFAFTGTALLGTTEDLARWKRGVALVQTSEGEAVGKLYVARYFPPESKARMEKLVANLLAAYRDSIDSLDWMGPQTKQEAKAKLAKFTPKIGYPSRWIDYSGLVVRRDDLLGNVERARAFEHARQIAKLGQPVDREEWHMTPQTVNAYYNPTLNEVVFPAAILQPPFFDPKADDAVNYGGIGAVIGHEISHGFDDSGSQYDGLGNLRLWWTADDRERFGQKTKALVDEYSAFSPVPGYTVNGGLTLGENIADNSGLEIAYKAYHASLGGKPAPVLDGSTGDQRFFYGFAQIYRAKTREAALLSQIKSDPHSPEEFRVNGVLRNHPAFYTAFNVKPGDAMYLPPDKRVLIW